MAKTKKEKNPRHRHNYKNGCALDTSNKKTKRKNRSYKSKDDDKQRGPTKNGICALHMFKNGNILNFS